MAEDTPERRQQEGRDVARACHSEGASPKEPTQSAAGDLAWADRARRGASDGLCLAEGTRLLERALSAGLRPRKVLISERAAREPSRAEARALAAARAAGFEIRVVDDAAIAQRTEGRTFGDVLTILPRPRVRAEDLLAKPGPLVALERVLDPGNLGTIARTAAAFGYAGLLVVGGTDPFHPKALRTSMGALFRLPVVHVGDDGPAWVARAKAAGRPSVATWLGGTPLGSLLAGGLAGSDRALWWLGSEAHGLRAETAAAADRRVEVEMPGADDGRSVDSLSIGAAAAVVLWAGSAAAATFSQRRGEG